MSKNVNPRKGYLHLYNPEEEGVGSYDVHYMNAYRKNKYIGIEIKKIKNQRYAA